jgi:putative ABC transport system permease protein
MLRSFLTITFRILWRNKVTSFVNIFSLSVGITAFIFIALYVNYEFSYDKFNEHYNQVYRLEADNFGKLNPLAAEHLYNKLPEVENITRMAGEFKGELIYSPEKDPENRKQVKASYFWADSTVFEVFTFPLLVGDPKTALRNPMTVVLTESLAAKLFGEADPIMKTIDNNGHQFMVTGVMEDIRHSHLQIDALFSMESTKSVFAQYTLDHMNRIQNNGEVWSATYLLLSDHTNVIEVEKKIRDVLAEINDGTLSTIEFEEFRLLPLEDIYLKGETQKLSYGVHGNFKMVNVLIGIGIFLLVLAGINYVNLTTARSSIRAKEVALKRISGSSTNHLRMQLIMESVIVTMIALVVAMTIAQLTISKFSVLTGVNINAQQLSEPKVWLLLFGGAVLLGLLAGLYPAFYLTDIQPVRLMKGEGIRGSGGSFYRSMLMTFQFAMSIIMLVAIITNYKQLYFTRTADLGFDKEHIITVATPTGHWDTDQINRKSFKERLLQMPGIEKMAFSRGGVGAEVMNLPPMTVEGMSKTIRGIMIDEDYLDVLGLEMIGGRSFSKEFPADMTVWKENSKVGGCIVNETAAREFGIDDPIGKIVTFEAQGFQWEVIGVVRDFHFASLHDKIEPFSFVWVADPNYLANIRIKSTDIPETLKRIEDVWKKVYGQKIFDYHFLDETLDRQYKSDEQFAIVIGFFTSLALAIACLGLFALSSFMVSRRVKEIGVRKVLGASVGTIYSMFSWDFLKWILVAIVIATPVAWYLMKMWLNTFAYHIDLGIDVFVIAALVAIVIALLTVTGQSLKVARANPVDSLKYE